jgi:hypothetical protein
MGLRWVLYTVGHNIIFSIDRKTDHHKSEVIVNQSSPGREVPIVGSCVAIPTEHVEDLVHAIVNCKVLISAIAIICCSHGL